jgi:hypothetical protein
MGAEERRQGSKDECSHSGLDFTASKCLESQKLKASHGATYVWGDEMIHLISNLHPI